MMDLQLSNLHQNLPKIVLVINLNVDLNVILIITFSSSITFVIINPVGFFCVLQFAYNCIVHVHVRHDKHVHKIFSNQGKPIYIYFYYVQMIGILMFV